MDSQDYEPSIAPASFVANWRKKLKSQPRQTSPIYSIPDEDCSFEYDDQPLDEEAGEALNGDGHQAAENNDWAPDSSHVALSEFDDLQQESYEVSKALAGTMIRQ